MAEAGQRQGRGRAEAGERQERGRAGTGHCNAVLSTGQSTTLCKYSCDAVVCRTRKGGTGQTGSDATHSTGLNLSRGMVWSTCQASQVIACGFQSH